VLGLEAVLAGGERVRCGGRVVKNVTGYDLAKLYLGSLGTLAVLEAAWVRLCPVPEATAHLWLAAADPGAGLGPARLPSVRAAVWLSTSLAAELGCAAAGVLLSLAGDAPAVAADEQALARGHAVDAMDAGALGRLRAIRSRDPGLRIRLAAEPSALAAAATALAEAGAEVLAQPAQGRLWALAPDERALEAASRSGHGFLVEAAPPEVRETRELFGDSEALRPLQAAIKAQYDPHGILNPGRFAGRI